MSVIVYFRNQSLRLSNVIEVEDVSECFVEDKQSKPFRYPVVSNWNSMLSWFWSNNTNWNVAQNVRELLRAYNCLLVVTFAWYIRFPLFQLAKLQTELNDPCITSLQTRRFPNVIFTFRYIKKKFEHFKQHAKSLWSKVILVTRIQCLDSSIAEGIKT